MTRIGISNHTPEKDGTIVGYEQDFDVETFAGQMPMVGDMIVNPHAAGSGPPKSLEPGALDRAGTRAPPA